MSETAAVYDLAAAWLAVVGAALFVATAIGLVRLPDVYTRVHAPAKAGSLGVVALAAASLLHNFGGSLSAVLETLLLIVFAFITMPLSAQIVMRAAARRSVAADPRTRGAAPGRPPRVER